MLTEAESARLCVVLVATRNPLNIGAAARALSNFGFADLRVVRPYDAAFREARSAVGAAEILKAAREYDSVADAVADSQLVVGTSAGTLRRDAQHAIYRLEAAASQIRNSLVEGGVAILFGSEKFGLSNDDLSHCDWLLRIPAREQHPSMNLGQAVAVCLYEFIRNTEAPGQVQALPHVASTSAQQELLMNIAMDVLDKSGYLDRHPRANMQAELRRMIRRLHISSKDGEAALGMLRQALWKLKSMISE